MKLWLWIDFSFRPGLMIYSFQFYGAQRLAVWKVADCGRFPVKLQKSWSGLQPLNNLLSRQFFIPHVCAQHEHVRTCLKALNKFVKYKFFIAINISEHEIFPEGVSPLCAGVTSWSISKSQAGLSWGMQWRKRDYKLRYWRTETGYEAW